MSQYLQAEAAVSTKTVQQQQQQQQINKPSGIPQPTSFMSRIKQEQQRSSSTSLEFRAPQAPNTSSSANANEPTEQRRRSANETTLSEAGADSSNAGGVFAGMSFEIVGFEADEFEDQKFLLVKNGAKVVRFDPDLSNLVATPTSSSRRSNSNKKSDFVLLPMISPAPIANQNQVTIHWMVSCLIKEGHF